MSDHLHADRKTFGRCSRTNDRTGPAGIIVDRGVSVITWLRSLWTRIIRPGLSRSGHYGSENHIVFLEPLQKFGAIGVHQLCEFGELRGRDLGLVTQGNDR